MNKEFICKGCGEKFKKEFQSTTPDYCYICNEFYLIDKIRKLEIEIKNNKNDYLMLEEQLENANDWNKGLLEENKVLEKALELACETIKSMCPKPLWIGGTIPAPEVKDVEYFKEIAKEMMKSEELGSYDE